MASSERSRVSAATSQRQRRQMNRPERVTDVVLVRGDRRGCFRARSGVRENFAQDLHMPHEPIGPLSRRAIAGNSDDESNFAFDPERNVQQGPQAQRVKAYLVCGRLRHQFIELQIRIPSAR